MADNDSYVRDLKKSRGSAAVLKMDLVSLRGDRPGIPVLVFEGPEDTAVYYSWVKQLAPCLEYEPFVCKGKDLVLKLKDVVDRDMDGLRAGVFFFVDRDFDDLRGQAEDSERLLMTDKYSVENYLVSEDVLDSVLTHYFHCQGVPVIRKSVCNAFAQRYSEFLASTSELNFRIFLARRLGIEVKGGLPDKISSIASLELHQVGMAGKSADQVVKLSREPKASEIDQLRDEFSALVMRDRFRGKFALIFFSRWLELLAADRVKDVSHFFGALPKNVKVRVTEIGMEALAVRSLRPRGLAELLKRVEVAAA